MSSTTTQTRDKHVVWMTQTSMLLFVRSRLKTMVWDIGSENIGSILDTFRNFFVILVIVCWKSGVYVMVLTFAATPL